MKDIPLRTKLHKAGGVRVASEMCIVAGEHILMQRRPDDIEVFPGYWSFPGGHVDVGDDYASAAIREISEETGVQLTSKQVKLRIHETNYHVDRQETWVVGVFVAHVSKQLPLTSTAEGEVKWVHRDDFEQLNVFPVNTMHLNFLIDTREERILFTATVLEAARPLEVLSETYLRP